MLCVPFNHLHQDAHRVQQATSTSFQAQVQTLETVVKIPHSNSLKRSVTPVELHQNWKRQRCVLFGNVTHSPSLVNRCASSWDSLLSTSILQPVDGFPGCVLSVSHRCIWVPIDGVRQPSTCVLSASSLHVNGATVHHEEQLLYRYKKRDNMAE